MKKLIFLVIIIVSLCTSGFNPTPEIILEDTDSVAFIMERLGGDIAGVKPNLELPGVSIANGRSLILTGRSIDNFGRETQKQSKHFVCTSCHNLVKEDPNLKIADPQARLDFAKANGIPFLQGSSLYGVVNRTSYYNGDYSKKYGELVEKAKFDLRESIQLCATECSQGRPLEEWEMESVISYLWTIDLKLGDVDLGDEEREMIQKALVGEARQDRALEILEDSYLHYSPATFTDPPPDRKAGAGEYQSNPENGKLIYELSCLHCHERKRYSFFNLDNAKSTFQYLKNHMTKYTRYSVYQVARYGTSPIPGKKAYMPQYTEEKLSKEMMQDLRAYIEMMSK